MTEITPNDASVPPQEAPPQEAPRQEAPRQSFIARIFGVLFTPASTFRDIVRRPDWVGPALVILAISVASVAITMPRIDFESTYRDAMTQSRRNMSPDQQDRAIRIAVGFGKAMMWFRPIGSVAWPAILAAIYLLGVRLAGGEANYLMVFAITLYAQMPMLIRRLLNDIVALTRHNIRLEQVENLLRSNLSFLADLKTNPVAFTALAALDIFSIWAIIVTIVGLAATPRMTKGKSAAVVLTVTILFLLFGVGAVSISMLMRKA